MFNASTAKTNGAADHKSRAYCASVYALFCFVGTFSAVAALFFKRAFASFRSGMLSRRMCRRSLVSGRGAGPRPADATEAVLPGTAADGAVLAAKRRALVRDLTNGLEVFEDRTKSAFRAGQQACAAKLPSWVTRLLGLPGVIAAGVGRHYGLPWLTTLALGIVAVMVLVPVAVLMYSAGRKV